MTAVAQKPAGRSGVAMTLAPSRRATRVAPRLHPPRRVAIVRGRDRVHACADVAPRAVSTMTLPAPAAAWRLTDRGLAVVMGGFALLVLMSLMVVVSTFYGFSNAPLG